MKRTAMIAVSDARKRSVWIAPSFFNGLGNASMLRGEGLAGRRAGSRVARRIRTGIGFITGGLSLDVCRGVHPVSPINPSRKGGVQDWRGTKPCSWTIFCPSGERMKSM